MAHPYERLLLGEGPEASHRGQSPTSSAVAAVMVARGSVSNRPRAPKPHCPLPPQLLLLLSSMIGPVLQFADLQEICRPGERPRLGTVEAWARSQGVPFRYDGKGGIWTTVDALNHALGLDPSKSGAAYPIDIV